MVREMRLPIGITLDCGTRAGEKKWDEWAAKFGAEQMGDMARRGACRQVMIYGQDLCGWHPC